VWAICVPTIHNDGVASTLTSLSAFASCFRCQLLSSVSRSFSHLFVILRIGRAAWEPV
jgi:hypothetical protein